MGLYNTIKETAEASGLSLVWADLNEANLGINLDEAQWPILICIPPVVSDTKSISGALKSVARLVLFVLDKDQDQTTIEYKSADLETKIIEPMRMKGREFITRLNTSSLTDPETNGTVSVPWTPTYLQMDSNVHGVTAEFDYPFTEGVACEA